MNTWFFLLTLLFIIVSAAMVLIILVQRPQGGGLAGAFGGAGGGGTDSVFGGRVGDALTVITIIGFLMYIGIAIALNKVPIRVPQVAEQVDDQIGADPAIPQVTSEDGSTLEFRPIDGPPPGFDPSSVLPPVTTSPPGSTTPDGGSE